MTAELAPVPSLPVLTWRQHQILRFLRAYIHQQGYPPSMRDVADAVGLATVSAVEHQFGELVRKGCITREPGKPRALRITMPGER